MLNSYSSCFSSYCLSLNRSRKDSFCSVQATTNISFFFDFVIFGGRKNRGQKQSSLQWSEWVLSVLVYLRWIIISKSAPFRTRRVLFTKIYALFYGVGRAAATAFRINPRIYRLDRVLFWESGEITWVFTGSRLGFGGLTNFTQMISANLPRPATIALLNFQP